MKLAQNPWKMPLGIYDLVPRAQDMAALCASLASSEGRSLGPARSLPCVVVPSDAVILTRCLGSTTAKGRPEPRGRGRCDRAYGVPDLPSSDFAREHCLASGFGELARRHEHCDDR